MDPNTPILVGVGQANDEAEAREPVDLITLAAERALDDAGSRTLPIDLVGLTKIGTKLYRSAPAQVAARLGRPDARSLQANHGGHTAQVIVAHAATEIAAGRTRVALVAGGEVGTALKRGSFESDTGEARIGQPDEAASRDPDLALGDDLDQWLMHPHEARLGIAEPIQMYPLMETALARALGRTREAHIQEVSRLWAEFSQVAAKNPYAHDRRGYSAQEIATAGPGNRYVGYPYTKLMNSNQFVDQGAALLLCSVGVAEAHGIPRDRWIFPWASTIAHEPYVSARWNLHETPALAIAGRHLEKLIGRALTDAALVDLYACFPFAVQVQARALGLDPAGPTTLTGGMRFAGGPWNNYGTHQIANLVLRLRETPDALAIASTNGGLATRFCVMAYSGQPNDVPFRCPPYPITGPGRRRYLETQPTGEATIEAYVVPHDRANHPTHALAACLFESGARAWARLENEDDIAQILAADPIGNAVRFDTDGDRLVQ